MKKYILLLLAIFIIQAVNAEIIVSLINPQATFRANQGDIINYSIGAENKNEFPIEILIYPPEDLEIIFYGETNFSLSPGEAKEINYSITITETGNYTRTIPVVYKGNNESFSLQSTLFFIVPEIKKDAPAENTGGGSSSVPPKKVPASKAVLINETEENTTKKISPAQNDSLVSPPIEEEEETNNYIFWSIVIILIILFIVLIIIGKMKKKDNAEITERR